MKNQIKNLFKTCDGGGGGGGKGKSDNFVYIKRLHYKPCHECKTPFFFADFQREDGSQG